MKVLFVIDTLEIGGAEKSLLAIASRLRHFEPVIVVLYDGLTLLPDFENIGLRVRSCRLPGTYSFRAGIRAFREILKMEKPDIVHATLFRSEIIARFSLRNSGIPLIGSFVNDSYSQERYDHLTTVGMLKLNAIQWIDRFTAGWTTHFISITKAVAATNTKALRIELGRVTVIYRGRDVNTSYVITDSERKKLQKLCGGSFIFLSIARLLRRKGLMESIEAFATVVEKYPEARYLIAGEGHDRRIFEEKIDQFGLAGKVFLLGTRHDVPALLAYSDVFVFPSHYEGQGGALLEAMLAAKPIIGSDIDVVAESITDTKTGILFRLRDPNDLAKKMIWMLNHPLEAKQIGLNAHAEAITRFNVEEVARQHEELYMKVTKEFNRNT